MDQRLSLVTLGVANIERSRHFYEQLGWTSASDATDDIVFFQAGGMIISLWDRASLASDSAATDHGGWGGITLAHNVREHSGVDEILFAAQVAGAEIVREAAPTFWGGYSGVFADLDGHRWEIAWNEGWPIAPDGSVSLTSAVPARHLLDDAFAHHVWATHVFLDTCAPLSDAQLATMVPGTYGTIIETLRHLVSGDCGYLAVLSHDASWRIDVDACDVRELRDVWNRIGAQWTSVIAATSNADERLARTHEDGSVTDAPVGIRLAQALCHGSDHRSQIATALTTLGVDVPYNDVWAFGEASGRVIETPPSL